MCWHVNERLVDKREFFMYSVFFFAATGTPPWVSILIVSILGTGYTTVGGIRAVIWTDTFQAVIMVIGMITVIILVSRQI